MSMGAGSRSAGLWSFLYVWPKPKEAMTRRTDFTSQEFLRIPAAGIARLRASGPVVEIKFPIIGKVWITTTHDLAAHLLQDSKTFTLRKDGGEIAGLRWWMLGILRTLANNSLPVVSARCWSSSARSSRAHVPLRSRGKSCRSSPEASVARCPGPGFAR
jgi:hypothetical protein